MSVPEFHEAVFRWPHSDAKDVVVTGEFDSWSQTIHLNRTSTGFETTVKIPWGRKVAYKYIVDGRWTTTDSQPTELDPMGNINNVYTAPARPIQPKREAPPPAPPAQVTQPTPVETKPQTNGFVNGVLATAKETVVGMVEAIAPGTTTQSQDTPAQTPAPKDEVPASAPSTVSKDDAPAPEPSTASPAPTAQTAVTIEPTPSAPSTITDKSLLKTPDPSLSIGEPSPHMAVLPAKLDEVAPVVPVPVLPLITDPPSPATVAEVPRTLSTAVVEGAVTSDAVPSLPEPSEGISTHTPAVNGTSEAAQVPLPAPTPSEVPSPATPAANGTPKKAGGTSSDPTTPTPSSPSSAHKEKRMAFPTLGRHHRHSSSASVSEHGESTSPGKDSVSSRLGTKKKRTSSIFGKLKDIFHHDHEHQHSKDKSEKAKK